MSGAMSPSNSSRVKARRKTSPPPGPPSPGGERGEYDEARGFDCKLRRFRRRQRDLHFLRLIAEVLAAIGIFTGFEIDAHLASRDLHDRRSKSSPPRNVSPLVPSTLNTPSRMLRIEQSKVPPPRS